jgi:hypothetical protein
MGRSPMNRETFIRDEEGLWLCEFSVGSRGGEGSLADLAPYGLDERVGLTINDENRTTYRRLLMKGEIRVALIKTWDGVVAW